MKNQEIRLSPLALNLFLECPRCFWLRYRKGIKRPEGYHPTLLTRMDVEIKNYFSKFRGSLPPELENKVNGKLIADLNLLKQWQNTRKPVLVFYPEPKIRFAGALDDCLISKSSNQKYYIPIDFKSRGSDINKDPVPSYSQNQLDCYTLLLEKNGYKTKNTAYLIYYILEKVQKNGLIKFKVEVVEVKTNPKRALKVLDDAIETLKGAIPEINLTCEYCKYRGD